MGQLSKQEENAIKEKPVFVWMRSRRGAWGVPSLLAVMSCIGASLCGSVRANPSERGEQPSDRPNVIFILADDMGWGDPGYQGGRCATPAIDRIASEGIIFSDAHTTSSVCTPTRYGIMTGRYNWRSSLKKGVLGGESPPLIERERMTVAGFLGQNGYDSTVIGKWHLGLGWAKLERPRKATSGETKGPGWDIDYEKRVDGGPLDLGFTEDFLYPASLDMPPYVYLRNDKAIEIPSVTKAFKVPNRPGAATADFEAENCLSDFAREAVDFIDRKSEAKRPFFMYLPLTSPHTPIVPTERWLGKSGLGDYGDFVMETDWVVGQVLEALDRNGISENTLLIFTADNGCSPMAGIPELEAQGHFPNGKWRGHKADIFEGGHRVPFVVRWPKRIMSGGRCSQTVCTVDFFATAADAIGKLDELPSDAAEDSFSLLPLLLEPGREQAVRPFTIHHSINGSFAIRRGDWKLCECADSGGWSEPKPGTKKTEEMSLPPLQLYDLGADPGERKNLQGERPEVVKELLGLLEQAREAGRTRP